MFDTLPATLQSGYTPILLSVRGCARQSTSFSDSAVM